MKKSHGIVRNLDNLGRITLPRETRRILDIDFKDALEIFADESTIMLKKYEPLCIFCGNSNGITYHKDKSICCDCLEDIKSI